MSLNKKKIDTVDIAGKRVFMRVDFNVPQDEKRPKRVFWRRSSFREINFLDVLETFRGYRDSGESRERGKTRRAQPLLVILVEKNRSRDC